MQKYTIYTLSDSATGKPFYVGSTTNPLNIRLNIHVWCAKNRPVGTVYKVMNSLGSKPIIDALEVFDEISNLDARKVELFWINQLRHWGFQIVNDQKPHNDKAKYSLITISDEERQLLETNWKYLALVSSKVNYGISNRQIQGALRTKKCDQITYRRIRAFIERIKNLDTTRVVTRHRVQMIILKPEEVDRIRRRIPYLKSKQKCELTGIYEHTLIRSVETGIIRFDKYDMLAPIICP